MNEIRDLMIGIDFGETVSRLSYYDRKIEEPCSVSMQVGTEQVEIPTILCRRLTQRDYCIGTEAEYFTDAHGGIPVRDLYRISGTTEAVQVADDTKRPFELTALFLKGLLKFLGVMDLAANTRCLGITVEDLTPVRVENLKKACEFLGFSKEQCLFMDHREAFYYYVMTQKREIWNRNVGWLVFTPEDVVFRRLLLIPGEKETWVKLDTPVSARLPKEPQLRDEVLSSFLKRNLKTDPFSSIHMNGPGFDQSWAKESLKILCYQRRKVFYGDNLFVHGACMAGVERKEKKNLRYFRYLSDTLVMTEIGMEMRVMGAPAWVPLIESGKNWYECSGGCELILDDMEELVFVVGQPSQEKKKMVMKLPGLPKRPNKTTRLSLELVFEGPKECRITVKDLGFGEMFPSSQKIWKESITLEP